MRSDVTAFDDPPLKQRTTGRNGEVHRRRQTTLAMLMLSALLAGCHHTHARPPDQPMTSAMSSRPESSSLESTLQLSATQSASLSAQFRYYAEIRRYEVRYELRNLSREDPLAVFDRGAFGRSLDAVGPTGGRGGLIASIGNGDATLTYDVEASGALPPEVRLLALELAPGGSLKYEAWGILEGDAPVQRVRLCVPVAPFVAAQYQGSLQSSDGPVHTAGADALRSRQLLCSHWVDVSGPPDWRG